MEDIEIEGGNKAGLGTRVCKGWKKCIKLSRSINIIFLMEWIVNNAKELALRVLMDYCELLL
jgi:hypothetical protein